ncbi:MAG: hypothetical protein AAF222_06115 [Pseudomonadota bacterium]
MLLQSRATFAALLALAVLQSVMLASLFAGVAPHPPAEVVPFGMAPFLAASLSAVLAAMVLGAPSTAAGRAMTTVAILLALVSFGPQKLLDPTFSRIYPAVFTAWIAIATLVIQMVREARSGTPG